MLVVTLLLSLTAFSQKDTSREQKVCMPLSVAQAIAADLLRYDSTLVELQLTQSILYITEQKIIAQDSVIAMHKQKITIAQQQQLTQQEMFNVCSTRVTDLQEEVATLTNKNNNLKRWIKGLGGGLVATLGVLALMITLK